MQEIRSSNPPVVTGIYDPNNSRAQHHCSLEMPFFSFGNLSFNNSILKLVLLFSFKKSPFFLD